MSLLDQVEQDIVKPGLLPLDTGGPKIILHTTEGGTADLINRCRARDLTAFEYLHNANLGIWKRGQGYPTQYLLTPPIRRATQCVPNSAGGYALEDVSGGVRTNRAGTRVIQIEVCAHSQWIQEEFSDDDWRWFGQFLRELCAAEGVPFAFPVDFMPYPSSYGNNGLRLTGSQYQELSGIIGHQHVPENSHGDPGDLRIDLMVGTLPPPVPPTPPAPGDNGSMYFAIVTVTGAKATFIGKVYVSPVTGILLAPELEWIDGYNEPQLKRYLALEPHLPKVQIGIEGCLNARVDRVPQGDGAYTWTKDNFGKVG